MSRSMLGLVVPLLLVGAAANAFAQDTQVALQKQMSKTAIDGVDCKVVPGLCEVRSGNNIYYTDKAAKILIIGHVYDLDRHIDLTEAALEKIKSMIGSLGGKTGAKAVTVGSGVDHISLAGLSRTGAVEWGNPKGQVVSIFTDYHCPYCRAVVHELESMNVWVVEYPISILGSRGVAEQVICAKDRVKAMKDAYAGVPLEARTCDTHGLDENEAFARLHHISETPVLVRADGGVLHGYRPHDILENWIAGKNQ